MEAEFTVGLDAGGVILAGEDQGVGFEGFVQGVDVAVVAVGEQGGMERGQFGGAAK